MPLLTQHKLEVMVSNTTPGLAIPVLDWDKLDGGKVTRSSIRLRRSAKSKKETLLGDDDIETVTTECLIDPAQHWAFVLSLKDGAYPGTTIALQPIDNAGVPVGAPFTFQDCVVVGFTVPPADANGADAAKLVIEWAVGS